MTWFEQIINSIGKVFKWWFIVQPWEQAIRVRFGKHVRRFEAGVHFQLPFFDLVYVQNTRVRFSVLQPQTITTMDEKTLTICGTLKYRVADVKKLYTSLHQPEDTICQEVESILTKFIISRKLQDCVPLEITKHIQLAVDLTKYGLADVEFFITDFAVVRTYRFINGDLRRYMNNSDRLDTIRFINSKERI